MISTSNDERDEMVASLFIFVYERKNVISKTIDTKGRSKSVK